MKYTKLPIIYIFVLILTGSCLSSSGSHDSSDSKINDSILDSRVKELIDSTLSPYIRFQWESFNINSLYSNNDTILRIKGTLRSEQYFYKLFDVSGTYKIIQSAPICINLSVSHSKAGNIFEMKEMYDSIFTFYTDSVSFLDNLIRYYENPSYEDQIALDRYNLVARAYANKTKVHFGISEVEYRSLGKDFQRNFYEGLIGKGAFESAEPRFFRNKFIGFEIIGVRDKYLDITHVLGNAKMIENKQVGYNAHEMFIHVHVCELCRIKITTFYDKFDGFHKYSLSVYWNK